MSKVTSRPPPRPVVPIPPQAPATRPVQLTVEAVDSFQQPRARPSGGPASLMDVVFHEGTHQVTLG